MLTVRNVEFLHVVSTAKWPSAGGRALKHGPMCECCDKNSPVVLYLRPEHRRVGPDPLPPVRSGPVPVARSGHAPGGRVFSLCVLARPQGGHLGHAAPGEAEPYAARRSINGHGDTTHRGRNTSLINPALWRTDIGQCPRRTMPSYAPDNGSRPPTRAPGHQPGPKLTSDRQAPPSRSRLNIGRGWRAASCLAPGSKETSVPASRPVNTKTGSGATTGMRASHEQYQKLISASVDGNLHT